MTNKEQLIADKALLEKIALGEGAVQFLKGIAPHLLTIAGMTAAGGALGYYAAKTKMEQHKESLGKSYNSLLNHPDFTAEPDKFHNRFSELSLISPTIASNPRLALKVIAPKLNKGFDLDDIHRLSAIEYHSTRTSKVVPPEAAARMKAFSGFEHAIGLTLPSIVMQTAAMPQMMAEMKKEVQKPITQEELYTVAREKLKAGKLDLEKYLNSFAEGLHQGATPMDVGKALANLGFRGAELEKYYDEVMRRSEAMEKKSSPELTVSEECLGRMLADTHMMCKTAAFSMKGMSKLLKPSTDAMKGYFQLMAIPLAIGGGIQLVNKLMEERETSKSKELANGVFAGLRRSSDVIKENPELANEAFDSLRSFAPSLATKPLIAKTFVEHVINSGGRGLTPEAANQLASTETVIKRLNESSGGSFIAGLKEPMSLFGHSIAKPKEEGEKGVGKNIGKIMYRLGIQKED